MNINKKTADTIVAEKTKNNIMDPAIDMSELYFKLGTSPMFASKRCPTLSCGMPMIDGFDYLTVLYDNNPILIYTRAGLSDDDVFKIVVGESHNFIGVVQPCPVVLETYVNQYMTKCNIASFYRLGAIISRSLGIPCPQIFIMNELLDRAKNGRGNTFTDRKRIVTHIEIYEKDDFGEIDMFEALAHEMRHCWQIENHYEKYFSTFKNLTEYSQICGEQYHLQPAEIDAIAYALRFIQAFTGQDYSANTIYPRVNQVVEKYAESLDDSLFVPFEGMYK